MDNTKLSKYIIYALIDPRDNKIRYIGLSSIGLKRAKTHLIPSQRKIPTYKNNWINGLLSEGLKFEIKIIEECSSREELAPREIFWIAHYKSIGAKLTNLTDGGEGALNPSEESRRKKAEKKKLPRPVINGILHRPCGLCKETKPVTEFSKSKDNCDGYNHRCRPCVKQHRLNNLEIFKIRRKKHYNKGTEYNKLPDEERLAIRRAGAEKARKARKLQMEENPELRKSYKGKPLIAISRKDPNITLSYNSAMDAKKDGFCNSGICRSMRNNKTYKGFYWSFQIKISS